MTQKKHILFFLTFICYSIISFGDNTEKLDSLIYEFKTIKNDSLKLEALTKANDILLELDKDSTFSIWNSIIEYCELENLRDEAALCRYYKARRLRVDGEYIDGLHLFQEVLTYYDQTNNTAKKAQVHNSLGILFSKIGDYKASNKHYTTSANLYGTLNDSVQLGRIYLNLGGLYESHDSFEQAENYLKESEKILNKYNNHNILNCEINLGLLYNKQKRYKKAYLYFQSAYEISKTRGDSKDKFMGPYHLGEFLYKQNRTLEAEPYLMEALRLIENPQNQKIIDVAVLSQFTSLLNEFYKNKNDYKTAEHFLKQHLKFENENKSIQASHVFTRQEMERVAKQKQRRRDLVIAISLAFLLFSLLFLFLIYRSYKHKQKANRLLTEMDELKTQMYSNISHELRTPLTLILGPLEQMLASEAQKKPNRRQIKLMRKNANSILKLVNQMLDLSKIDAKGLTLELEESDVVKFIKIRFANFASLAEQRKVNFNSYLPPNPKVRFFDGSKLEKIINNLLSNAIKFTPQGGQVFCFASFPKPNLLELTVQDTGSGIPNDELNLIFDRFHQVNNNHTNNNIGTGIGLALTKELVELMHGKIVVDSIVDEGTKFKITLPLGKDHLKKDEYTIVDKTDNNSQHSFENDSPESCEKQNHSTVEHESELPHVLVVDDHPEISAFIKENLTNCYSVDTAENGLVGLEMAIENIPDLIISDLMMPQMDGIEMSRKLKTDERTSHIPIIILTAKSKIDDKLEGLETGADAFIAKPFSMKELSLRVKMLINQRKKLRERYTNNINLEPKDITVTSADEKFLNRVLEVIENNMSNSEFEVRQLQEEMYMSRMQLFRKIKALTNQTPGEFIRTIRLKRAAKLIEQNYGNIAQISYEVGFNNPSYFAKCFKNLFGDLPSEYSKQN